MGSVFLFLSVVDLLAVCFSILPKYIEIARLENRIPTGNETKFLNGYYKDLVSASPELQSSFHCKILSFSQNYFRSLSAWLIVGMTYFRVMSVAYPIKHRSRDVTFYVKRCVLISIVILMLHSFPIITKDIITLRWNLFNIKLCHHVNILGIEFYHFEKIFTAMVFPVSPCLLVVILNIALLIQYRNSTKEPVGSGMIKQQSQGMLQFAVIKINVSHIAYA